MADVASHSTLTTGLVSYWEMEEASGTRFDAHGTHDLTDNNTVGQTTGQVGDAADLESANSEYFSVADHADFDVTDTFSYALWFKPESLATTLNSQRLLMKGNLGGDGNGGYRLTYYNASGSNKLLMQIWDSSNTDEQWNTTNAQITSAGTWYFVAVTVEASTSSCTFYIDGSSVGTSNIGGSATGIGANSGSLYIGSFEGSSGYVDGVIDQVGFWNKVLTSGEVSDLYNSGNGLVYEEASAGADPVFFGFNF